MLRITLKSLFSTLHISGKFALLISFVMPSLPGAFLFVRVLQACTTSALVIGRSKCADFVSFTGFASSVSICRFLSWLTFTSALIKFSR